MAVWGLWPGVRQSAGYLFELHETYGTLLYCLRFICSSAWGFMSVYLSFSTLHFPFVFFLYNLKKRSTDLAMGQEQAGSEKVVYIPISSRPDQTGSETGVCHDCVLFFCLASYSCAALQFIVCLAFFHSHSSMLI